MSNSGENLVLVPVEHSSNEYDGHEFDYHGQITVYERRHTRAKVRYEIDSFVALRDSEAVGSSNVWIGKVMDSCKDAEDYVVSIGVHLFETRKKRSRGSILPML